MRIKRSERTGTFSGLAAERAIIDIGSNTVRLVVYGGAMRAPRVLLNEKVVAKLGQEISRTGVLAQAAINLAMRGLKRYALLLDELGVEDVETVATAAVRDARNGQAFLKEVAGLGLTPRLLSGAEEARLSAAGVMGAFPGACGVVADLGGGSLELVRIEEGAAREAGSLPLGTLRLAEHDTDHPKEMLKKLGQMLKDEGWGKAIAAPLYLVGGTWRAMAVYAMHRRAHPLSDPHGLMLEAGEADALATELSAIDPPELRAIERISTMRAATLPLAALLLKAMLKRLEPERLIFSSWGLREGLLYDRLEAHEKSQDPLLAGVAHFAAQRGTPALLATRIAGWTAGLVPPGARGSERLRVSATMLALASMQVEPNIRHHQAIDWALHKRWIALEAEGRAMLAAAVAANGNKLDLPAELRVLASEEALEEAICWGLATRLARRIGARSQTSLQVSRIALEEGRLILRLARSHEALFGVAQEKDMKLLAGRLGKDYEVVIMDNDSFLTEAGPASSPEGAEAA